MEFFSNNRHLIGFFVLGFCGFLGCGDSSDASEDELTGLEAFYNKPGGGTPIGGVLSGGEGAESPSSGGESTGGEEGTVFEGGENTDLCGDQECGGPYH